MQVAIVPTADQLLLKQQDSNTIVVIGHQYMLLM